MIRREIFKQIMKSQNGVGGVLSESRIDLHFPHVLVVLKKQILALPFIFIVYLFSFLLSLIFPSITFPGFILLFLILNLEAVVEIRTADLNF